MAAAKCPNCGQFKYEKPFILNKGIGLIPLFFGAGFSVILPRIISNIFIIIGVLASIYTFFIWKPKSEFWKCGHCKFSQNHQAS
jgi:hypothetical protein